MADVELARLEFIVKASFFVSGLGNRVDSNLPLYHNPASSSVLRQTNIKLSSSVKQAIYFRNASRNWKSCSQTGEMWCAGVYLKEREVSLLRQHLKQSGSPSSCSRSQGCELNQLHGYRRGAEHTTALFSPAVGAAVWLRRRADGVTAAMTAWESFKSAVPTQPSPQKRSVKWFYPCTRAYLFSQNQGIGFKSLNLYIVSFFFSLWFLLLN